MTPLSARELEVARLVAEGLSDKEAAAILQVSPNTVASYLTRIAHKIGAKKNRRVAIARFVERTEVCNENNDKRVA